MRRSFSALFGRFFARAYLELHHDFVWFAAIDGDNFHISKNWRVSRKPKSRTEMPDWICARPGELAVAEAKGSHQKGNASRGGTPNPIKTADGQIKGVLVQKRVNHRTRQTWQSKSVKGWAVMSRWGLADPPRDPFLYVLDPETEGETPMSGELDELVQAVARAHVKQTVHGLGLLTNSDDLIDPARRRGVRLAEDVEGRRFVGSFITPFGPINLDIDRAKQLASLLPDPSLVRFVGLNENVLNAYLEEQPLAPGERQRIGDRSLVGPDGLVVAQIQQVMEFD